MRHSDKKSRSIIMHSTQIEVEVISSNYTHKDSASSFMARCRDGHSRPSFAQGWLCMPNMRVVLHMGTIWLQHRVRFYSLLITVLADSLLAEAGSSYSFAAHNADNFPTRNTTPKPAGTW